MTLRITGYTGPVEPRVQMSFTVSAAPGSVESEHPRHQNGRPAPVSNYRYRVRNPGAFASRITFSLPQRQIVLNRRASPGDDRFDDDRDAFIYDGVPATDLNELFVAHDLNQVEVYVTVSLRYLAFFDELLRHATLTEGTHNLARPPDPAAVERSFVYTPGAPRGRVSQGDRGHEVAVPATLIPPDRLGAPARSGGPPLVMLELYLLVRERFDGENRNTVTRVFAATDYARLYATRRGGPNSQGASERLRSLWHANVVEYLRRHSSIARGRRIFAEIVAAGRGSLGGTQAAAIQAVRDAVDARLVAANDWPDERESAQREPLQRKLSDLLGALNETDPDISPVGLLRTLHAEHRLPGAAGPAPLILQFGVGHCGEHTHVCFAVLAELIATDARATRLLRNVIHTGYVNLDHVFAIGGFSVTQVAEMAAHPAVHATTSTITVFDLQQALAQNAGAETFVLDAYLSATSATAAQLLERMRRATPPETRLRIQLQSPSPIPGR